MTAPLAGLACERVSGEPTAGFQSVGTSCPDFKRHPVALMPPYLTTNSRQAWYTLISS